MAGRDQKSLAEKLLTCGLTAYYAEFCDRNKQERGKNQKSTNNAMSHDGSSIKIIDWSDGDSTGPKKPTNLETLSLLVVAKE